MGSTAATDNQPTPHGKGPAIAALVCADIMARNELGVKKYGEALRAHNGRDALVDLYQELLDGAQYLRQELEERHVRPSLIPLLQRVCTYIESKEDTRAYSDLTTGKRLYVDIVEQIAALASLEAVKP